MKTNAHKQLMHSALKILCIEPLATMDRIAEACNVSRMTLFRVFKSRQNLIDTLVLASYDVCNKIINDNFNSDLTAKEKIEQSVKELIPVGAMFRFLSYIPWKTQNVEINENEQILNQKWRCLLIELKIEGLLSPEISIDWAVISINYLILAAWEALDNGEIAPKTAHEQVLQIFFNGVLEKK